MFHPMTSQNFRYTFGRKSVTNLPVTEGLYEYGPTVISVDAWGEARVANETPVNNVNKMLKGLMQELRKRGDSFGA